MNEKRWGVWVEGYSTTGDCDRAQLVGEVQADSFESACKELLSGNSCFDPNKLTLWGCKLFDNETDARKAFG